MNFRKRGSWAVVFTVVTACGPAVDVSSGDSTTVGGTSGIASSSDAPTTTPLPGSTTHEPEPGTSSSDSESSSSTGCVDMGPTSVPDPDDPESRCDLSASECGCGYKCNAYIPNEQYSGRIWENNGCFPLDPEPVDLGAPCTFGGFSGSGYDDCPDGAMCWDVDGDGDGTCREYCDWDSECTEPGAQPWIGCQSCGCVCMISCSPLTGGCDEGENCYLVYSIGICGPDLSGDAGAVGDPCSHERQCNQGNACLDASAVPGCDGESYGCCTPYCNVDEPDCPEGSACSPLWNPGEAEAPILEGLGYCIDETLVE